MRKTRVLVVVGLLITGWYAGCSENSTSSGGQPVDGTDILPSPFPPGGPDSNSGGTTVPGTKDATQSDTSADTESEEGTDGISPPESTEDPWGIPEEPEEAEFGWPCDENSECNSGFCVQTPAGKVCTDTCLENCPPSWACSEVTVTGADTTYICKPKYLHLCDPCETNEDCADIAAEGAKCLPRADGGGSFCGVDCSAGQGCPTGYSCQSFDGPAGLEYLQCAPLSGECQCSPLASSLGLTTTCAQTNSFGTCEGTRMCLEGSGLTPCDGDAPAQEVCDGMDNDCDGLIDNIAASACQIENDFGSCPGEATCESGVEICVGNEPTPELCDGLDNDCDGETDEDLCDDGDPCTKDTCVQLEEVLECSHAIDDTLLCDDGNICTTTDKCEAGDCKGFNPQICDDGNPCTDDSCDPTVGCLTSFNAEPCEDGNQCTTDDFCLNGGCQPGPVKTCDDGNPCTTDSCDPAVQGGCVQSVANEGFQCDYAGIGQCQKAKCSLGQCVPFNNDGVGCTTSSSDCSSGVCSGGVCNVIPGQTCQVDGGICSSDVPGTCTTSGSCVPAADGGCVCDSPCNGVCLCCKVGGLIPVQVCIPF